MVIRSMPVDGPISSGMPLDEFLRAIIPVILLIFGVEIFLILIYHVINKYRQMEG